MAWSAAITGVANLASNLISNSVGSSNVDKTNEANKEIAQSNQEWQTSERVAQQNYNTDMWNAENEYNSAASQVQRYKEAGINPYLAMSGSAGSAGSASSANSASTPGAPNMASQQAFQPTPFQSNLSSLLNESAIAKQQAAGMKIDNEYKPAQLALELDTMNTALKGIGLDNKNKALSSSILQGQAESISLSNQLNRSTMQNQIEQSKQLTAIQNAQLSATLLDNESKTILNKYLEPQQQADLMIKGQTLQNLVAGGNLTKANEKLVYRQMQSMYYNDLKTQAEINATQTKTKISEKDLDILNKTADSLVATTLATNLADQYESSEKASKYKTIKGSRQWNPAWHAGFDGFNYLMDNVNPLKGLFK